MPIKIKAEDGTVQKMNKIRFGIYGAGTAANVHANALKSLSNAELCGIADRLPDFSERLASEHSVKAYRDFEEMLSDENIDAVCICTQSGYHAKDALTALDYGKHLVIEKPIAMNTEDAVKIKETAEKKGCKVTVISQLRFSEDVHKAKLLIKENAFGKITFCDLYMKYFRDREYYKSSPWRGSKNLDGGVLMNQGIHGIDLLLYLAGNAKVLCSKSKTMYHNIEAPDSAAALLEFEEGALGVIEASVCSYPGFERRLEITGTEGCVVLRENTIEKLVADGKTIVDRTGNANKFNTSSNPKGVGFELHARQLDNFIRALNGKEELLCTVDDGIAAVELANEIE